MLKMLRHIVSEVNITADLSLALKLVVERTHEALKVDACSIYLTDEDHGEYVLSATIGLDPSKVGKTRIKFGMGLIGLVGEREEPIRLENALTHTRCHKMTDLGEKEFKAFLGVPIIHQGDLVGILVILQLEKREFLEDEEAFLITLSAQLASEIAHASVAGAVRELTSKRRRKKKSPDMVLVGLPGASGVAIGKAVVVYPPANLDAVLEQPAKDIDEEIALFEAALTAAKEEIHQLQARAKTALSVAEQALFDAYLRILDSRSLMNEIIDEIENGQWAQGALRRVIKRHILQFESLDDEYLKERAADFRDLGRRILAHLQANKRESPEYPKRTILVSAEITATAMLELPEGHLAGIVSGSGSSNSHVAILARALGIPTAMGVIGIPIAHLTGKDLIVDGYNGQVYVSPSDELRKEFELLAEEELQLDEALAKLADKPAATLDNHTINLFVNTGLLADSSYALKVGAEGVGLYRTELPFMVRDRFPTEEEQRIMYRQLLTTFSPRQVIMRTLDIGGDKILPYFPIDEENPFLGWRGVRVTLDHPEIFLQQIRAMLQASVDLNNLAIMLPMISATNEVEDSIRLIRQAYEELIEDGLAVTVPPIGLMIEVPAAVYQAYELAKLVDFVSVGSNDLIQYLLAVDRNNPRVASTYNGLHPAVIRALSSTVKNVHKAKKKISICGELAAEPLAVVLLLGMGFDSLSVDPRSLPRVKWIIRQFSFEKAKELLNQVLKMDDAVEVRIHLETAIEESGLGGLIRAGKL